GVMITAVDVLLILLLQHKGFRWLEAFVIVLVATIGGCFAVEMYLARPDAMGIASGLLPTSEIVINPAMLYLALGILGATVMPHNLYLHSSIVQTRHVGDDREGKRDAIRLGTVDSCIALSFAFLVNAAILILAASTFHGTGYEHVADIMDAHELLAPLL